MSTADAGLDTIVAGLRCRDVLDDLSEFLDGNLSPSRVTAIEAHLAGCDRCSRFGGEIASTLSQLRACMQAPPALAPAQSNQLRAALRRMQAE